MKSKNITGTKLKVRKDKSVYCAWLFIFFYILYYRNPSVCFLFLFIRFRIFLFAADAFSFIFYQPLLCKDVEKHLGCESRYSFLEEVSQYNLDKCRTCNPIMLKRSNANALIYHNDHNAEREIVHDFFFSKN